MLLVTGESGLRVASEADIEVVYALVQETIRAVYPNYYEPAIVEAFCRLHNRDAVAKDVKLGKVVLLESDDRAVGTGTLDGYHVTRVFVRPSCQGSGFGSMVMRCLETSASASFETTVLDSSAPAERFYQNRGYRVTGLGTWEIAPEGNLPQATLTYKVMEKQLI